MKITQEEYSLLEELASEHDFPALDTDKHVTAKMLAEKIGIGEKRASEILKAKMKRGELKREWVRQDNGRACYGYYK